MPADLSLLFRAATFAANKHRDQRRKDVGASPYINHPLAVASRLVNDGGVNDVQLLCAALLHDTVEDTATTFDELTEAFGEEISQLVSEVTDDKSLKKEERKQLQIEHAPHKSERAKQLKIADKICNVGDINAESPAGWSRERKLEYFDWAENVIAGCRGVNESLDRAFDLVLQTSRKNV